MRIARNILAAIWIGVLALAMALALYVKFAVRPPQKPQATQTETGKPTPSPTPSGHVTIYLPVWEKGVMSLRRKAYDLPSGADPVRATVERLVAEAPEFPRGTKVLGVRMDGPIAIIDFSPAVKNGMGDDEEASALASLQKTMGQFPKIEKLRIQVNGRDIESLGGHSDDTKDPLPVER